MYMKQYEWPTTDDYVTVVLFKEVTHRDMSLPDVKGLVFCWSVYTNIVVLTLFTHVYHNELSAYAWGSEINSICLCHDSSQSGEVV